MKNSLFVIFLVFILSSCASKVVEDRAKDSAVVFQRELVEFYADQKTTPLNTEEKNRFKGITFFPINETYRFDADFTPIADGNVIPFPTSAGKIKHYKEYGLVNFVLDGKLQTLTLYQSSPIMEAYADHLFLPFTDDTNGDTTYGGGRYIDLKIDDIREDGKVIVDFNQAYNPYCAYSKRYNCPIPPGKNSLDVEIKAGVTYQK